MIVYHEGELFQNSIASTLGFSGKIKLSGKGITTLLQEFLLTRNVVFLPKNIDERSFLQQKDLRVF